MNKTIFSKVLFTLFVLSTSLLISSNQYKVSVSNDMLVFEKSQDYYKVIRDLNKEQKEAFVFSMLNEMNFNSLAKFTNTELFKKVDDDLLSSILNVNGFVQIGNFIYKIDIFNEVVAVVPSLEYNETLLKELLSGHYKDSTIKVYSIDDEVIGMVESKTPPSSARLFCGQSGAGGDEKSGQIQCYDPKDKTSCNWMDCWVQYNRFGIYFALKAKCINNSPCRIMYWHKTPAAYKVKCGYTYGPVYQWQISSGATGGNNSLWNQYFYQNVQPLHAFWLRVVFMAKDPSWINNPDNPSVDLQIRKNM